MNNKHFFVLLVSCIFLSCNPKPKIPISETLKIALNGKYSNYVLLLNKSINNDSLALHQFVRIDYIEDAAGYDHGSVLVHLMEKIGDANYSKTLKSMSKIELNNIKNYFMVGIQGVGNSNDTLFRKFPTTFNYLGFTKEELETFK